MYILHVQKWAGMSCKHVCVSKLLSEKKEKSWEPGISF